MMVLVIESGAAALRGRITRWLLEVHPGVFVGRVSRRVREELWHLVQRATVRRGSAVIVYSIAGTEQGYGFETVGDPSRLQVDFDGLLLMQRSHPVSKKVKRSSAP